MRNSKNKDELFQDIIKDIILDIVQDTQTASDEIISLSTQFMDSESNDLVQNFHNICSDPKNSDQSMLSSQMVNTQKIDILQDGMQKVVFNNSAIRSEINIILGAMQFSELLRQNLDGVSTTFHVLTHSENSTIEKIKIDMEDQLHTIDERIAFYQNVMHEDLPKQDAEMTQAKIDQLLG